ncbi:hypothetical protein SAMN05216556_13217 [Aequorivita viscosa]|uniref:Uncharacterized protein n=2 Tax=Aequorivita viscosa TaxID=797419 RepID=A0A1M6NC26_9FLAO|nr:hypothetical protein SAMN05216556_13217 [Aequorivita viscosa]SHJ93300.1 hypothetical protein SAMN04487908_13313 [Aequorivita viscosa]
MLRSLRVITSKPYSMQKLYSNTSRLDGVNKKLVPKEETIRFLLDYSMALSVIDCHNKKFEALLN